MWKFKRFYRCSEDELQFEEEWDRLIDFNEKFFIIDLLFNNIHNISYFLVITFESDIIIYNENITWLRRNMKFFSSVE